MTTQILNIRWKNTITLTLTLSYSLSYHLFLLPYALLLTWIGHWIIRFNSTIIKKQICAPPPHRIFTKLRLWGCMRKGFLSKPTEWKTTTQSVLFVSFISLCCAELRKIKKLYLGGPCVVGEGYDDSWDRENPSRTDFDCAQCGEPGDESCVFVLIYQLIWQLRISWLLVVVGAAAAESDWIPPN